MASVSEFLEGQFMLGAEFLQTPECPAYDLTNSVKTL